MEDMFTENDWSPLQESHPDAAVEHSLKSLSSAVGASIPKRAIQQKQSSHPWLNNRVKEAVCEKCAASRTTRETNVALQCSKVIAEEREAWILKTKNEMLSLPRGSRAWWKKEKQLQQKNTKPSGIPALRRPDKTWALNSQDKSDILATTFKQKCQLPPPPMEESVYDEIIRTNVSWENSESHKFLTADRADFFLRSIDENSATGPDNIPARVLKRCHAVLAAPLLLLAQLILQWQHWPSQWIEHWIVAIYKKKQVFDPKNYRGVHMTPQVAKVMERLVGSLFLPSLSSEASIGENQFAYCKQRGSRDALLYLVLCWLHSFLRKNRVALYCSDVSGAFDKVSAPRLLQKLAARGMPDDILAVIKSWLRDRRGKVVVTGAHSEDVVLRNQVFQGTVWGPMLWNTYYADAKVPIRKESFEEIIFADDLNAFREYPKEAKDETILQDMSNCQKELHSWGRANQVEFDPGKESSHILSRSRPIGESFKILGVEFDCKLVMADAVLDLAKETRWKLKSVLRTKKYTTSIQLIDVYKSQILSFVECRTPAIYHACASALQTLDSVQDSFLSVTGMSDLEALLVANLAPVCVRRDIALLGVIHRTVLGRGPAHFRKFIRRCHNKGDENGKHRLQLHEFRNGDASDYFLPGSRPADYIQHSMLGLVAIYNILPAEVVEGCACVPSFQGALQDLVKVRAFQYHCPDWKWTLSPRIPLHRHPLLTMS